MPPVRQPRSGREIDLVHLSVQGGDESPHVKGNEWANSYLEAREGHCHPVGGEQNDLYRTAVPQAGVANPPGAAADLFCLSDAVAQAKEQGVPREAFVAQGCLRHRRGKSAWCRESHPGSEDMDLPTR